MASSGTSSTSRTTKSTTSATTWERRGEVRPSTWTKSWEDSLGEVAAQVVKHCQGTRLIELLVRAVFALELLSLEVPHHQIKRTQLGVCRGPRPYTNVT